MTPDSRKILKGLLFSLPMGVVTIYAMQQIDSTSGAIIAPISLAYLLATLLVFGVDIERIRFGRLKIDFNNTPNEYQRDVIVKEESKEKD